MRNLEMLKGFLWLEGLPVERVWYVEARYYARICGSTYQVDPRTLAIYTACKGVE